MTSRDYQKRDFHRILKAWDIYRRVLYVLPTGGGKSILIKMVTDWAYALGLRVLILTHRENLLLQASQHLHNAGIRHGLISPHYPYIDYKVQVASVQTAVNRLSRLNAPDIIIPDECHHSKASTWERVLEAFPRARVLGMTASPIRLDKRPLGDIYDTLVEGPPAWQLIAKGYLSPFTYYAPETEVETESIEVKYGEFDEAQTLEVVDKPKIIGDGVEHYQRICPGAPALAYCVTIDHAESVAEQFRLAGYRAETVHSKLERETIAKRLDGLRAGTLDVITSVALIGEGTDIPGVVAVLQFAPWNSLVSFLQACGRASRPVYAWEPHSREDRLAAIAAGPKPTAYILDFVNNYRRHGFPDDPREWSLDDGLVETPYVSRFKRCEICYAMIPKGATVCPECGEVSVASRGGRRLPDTAEGVLTEKVSLRSAVLRYARSVVDARGIAHTLGYDPDQGAMIYERK